MSGAGGEQTRPALSGDSVRDACLWFAIAGIVLWLTPVGLVIGDVAAQSAAYASGDWRLNPNHLLLEPAGAAWHHLLSWLGDTHAGVDQLRLLGVPCGALAVAVFRLWVADPLAETRTAANHGTAWLAASAAFLKLWVSGGAYVLQMPLVVLAGACFLWYRRTLRPVAALALGAAIGGASLCFVSNALLVPTAIATLGARLALRRDVRACGILAGGVTVGAGTIGGLGLWGTWGLVAPAKAGFLGWVTSYGGAAGASRVAEAYGVEPSVSGVAVAAARAAYGTLSAVVDVGPTAEALRDGAPLSGRLIAAGALLLLGVGVVALALYEACRAPSDSRAAGALNLVLAWGFAYVPFGVIWSNADDKFYLQLGVAFGALVAAVRLRPISRGVAFAAASAAVLFWNAGDVTTRLVLYPRAERLEQLGGIVATAGLVVYPGWDEVDQLLVLRGAPLRDGRLPLTLLAARCPPSDGLVLLEDRVQATLAAGTRVEFIDLYDVPTRRQPWRYLATLGYDYRSVRRHLDGFAAELPTRRVGPFTVRTLGPRPGGAVPPVRQQSGGLSERCRL